MRYIALHVLVTTPSLNPWAHPITAIYCIFATEHIFVQTFLILQIATQRERKLIESETRK